MNESRLRSLPLCRHRTFTLSAVVMASALACSSSDPGTRPGADASGTGGTTGAGTGGSGGPATSSGGSGGAASGAAGSAGSAGSDASPAGQGGAAGTTDGGAAGSDGGATTQTLMRSYTGSVAARGTVKGKLNIGREFTVTVPSVHVRDLGVWDLGANGLTEAHVVTLFALGALGLNPGTGATPVAGGSVTVPAGTVAPLDSGFRFAPLPQEVELRAGTYAVVAYGLSDTGDPAGDGGNIPFTGSGVTDGGFGPSQVVDAASPAFPNAGDQTAHTSASFHFTSPQPAFVRISPFGDSITLGEHGTNAGYRGPLHALLEAAHYPAQFGGSTATDAAGSNTNLPADQRHHEGHSGYQIQALQDNVVKWLGPTGAPADVVLLLAGTNDVVFNNDTDFANAGMRLSKLIATIVDKTTGLLPKARLIVGQLPPVTNTTWAARELTYNVSVAQVVADHVKLGEDVRLVDFHSALTVNDLFTDGEHPKDSGYQKMAQAWFNAITAP